MTKRSYVATREVIFSNDAMMLLNEKDFADLITHVGGDKGLTVTTVQPTTLTDFEKRHNLAFSSAVGIMLAKEANEANHDSTKFDEEFSGIFA